MKVSFCSNDRIHSTNNTEKKEAPHSNRLRGEYCDQFLRQSLYSTVTNIEKSYAGSLLNEAKISNRDQKFLDTLLSEYDAIQRENFDSQEEYEIAKNNAKKRYDDEVTRINNSSEEKKDNCVERFNKVVGAAGQFIKDCGKEIIITLINTFSQLKSA